MHPWVLEYKHYRPEQEPLREALCTLGNGYLGTRGAAPEYPADENHYPGTYVAGVFNRLTTEIGGTSVESESLVNLPNWLPLTFRIEEGPWFRLEDVKLHDYSQRLRLREGILEREIRFEDEAGRICRYRWRRFVHMGAPHLGAIEAVLVPENWSGRICFSVALDGRVCNENVDRYSQLENRHLQYVGQGFEGDRIPYLHVRTNDSHIEVALAARICLYRDGHRLSIEPTMVNKAGYVGAFYSLDVGENAPVRVEKVVSIYTDRDHASYEVRHEAVKAVRRAGTFEELASVHAYWWERLWERFDVAIECRCQRDDRVSRILRLHIFHILVTSSPQSMDLDAGVPARGIHGEAYRGHVFWDELFVFPILNLRLPEITRALLLYRYRRLGEARNAARNAGFGGAMYPWQSGSDGREESQQLHLNPRSGRWIPDNSRLQRHIGAAIAYNIWHYYQVTGDAEFISFFGAEMFLEIARFWASIARYDKKRKRYVICGVLGPDEYHDGYPDAEEPGLDNNAYTNIMAAWVLWRVPAMLSTLPEERRDELLVYLGVHAAELERWERISHSMFVPFHGDGIISQFEGYEKLREFDWAHYQRKYGDIQRLDRVLEAEQDTPNRYKASKQADVVMLFYLFSAEELRTLMERLGYSLGKEAIPRNIDYYMARTSHGSTLSRVVHSWVLARIDRKRSWDLFSHALESDVADVQGGTTPEGVHLGAMAGTVDLIQRCYTGIETRNDVLWLNPVLPEVLDELCLSFRYRGHFLKLLFSKDRVQIRSLGSPSPPIHLGFKDRTYELSANSVLNLPA